MTTLHEPAQEPASLLRPMAWFFYLVMGLEILFMISPVAFYFYSFYGPVLNVLNRWAETAWLTQFFLPHIAKTRSVTLNALPWIGRTCALFGGTVFLVTAAQLYWSKFRRCGPVTTGLYGLSRHPQYLGLSVLGFGALLIWPRFLVLVAYVGMLFMYRALATLEERRCERLFGRAYRVYEARTPLIRLPGSCPRAPLATATGAGNPWIQPARFLLLPVAAVAITVFIAFGIREYALSQITAHYENHAAVLSPAVLGEEKLLAAYHTALVDSGVRQVLASAGEAPLVIHVVPEQWHLADLPMEIETKQGGHYTPANFDRRYYKILFSRARTHESQAAGKDIVRSAYGLEPLLVAKVDISTGQVEALETPPEHVRWGNIPTPLF